MAQRFKNSTANGKGKHFPPEADGDFDVVPQDQIDALRAKLSQRFGIGQGKLVPMDVVAAK